MKKVYLAGPRIEGMNWREQLSHGLPADIETIDPFKIHKEKHTGKEIYERDLSAIEHSDLFLAFRTGGYCIEGALIESGIAYNCGIPLILLDVGGEPNEFTKWHFDVVVNTFSEARKKMESCL